MNNFLEINLDVDKDLLQNAKKSLANSPKKLKAAFSRAAKRAGNTMRRAMTDEAVKKYYIQAAKIKKAIKTRFFSTGELHIIISGKRQTLASYYLYPRKRPKARQSGLHGAVMRAGGTKFFPTGFLLRDNLPFQRIGPNKKDIEPIISPSIPQIIGNPESLEKIEDLTIDSFEKNLRHEILFALGVFKS